MISEAGLIGLLYLPWSDSQKIVFLFCNAHGTKTAVVCTEIDLKTHL